MTTCTARIRPLLSDVEIACERTDDHDHHRGTLRGYAYEGSVTTVDWFEADRRTYHGYWPGRCPAECVLPAGHRGKHAP